MLLRLLLNLFFFLPLFPFVLVGRLLGRRRRVFVRLVLRGDLPIAVRPRRLPQWRPPRFSMLDLVRATEQVVRDGRVQGVLVEILPLAFGWATAEAVRARLAAVRAAGKRVVAYLPQGGGTKELYVASAAEEVYVAPGAPFWAVGLHAESTFFGEAFSRLGLEAQVEATGPYKSAGDRFSRGAMSFEDRAQLDRILDVTYGRVVSDVARARSRTDADVRAFFDAAPQSGEQAALAGLVDGVLHEDQLHAKLAHPKPRLATAPIEALLGRWPLFLPLFRGPRVAVIPVTGAIVPGGALPGWASRPTADTVISALRVAARDRAVVGVVLAVDSPGGSATASEAIHREVVRVAEKKPIVALFGDVAASGGYYVAVAAHRILTSVTTVTGSIGVVGGKIVLGGLLEKLGIHREVLTRGARAALLSPTRPWSEAERAAFREQLFRSYREFVGRVAEGRKRPPEEVEPLAGGRVWAGIDAIEKGLADGEGDLASAVEEVRRRAGSRGGHARAVAYGGPSHPPPPAALAAAHLLATEPLLCLAATDVQILG